MKKEQSKKYRLIQALRILTQVIFFGLFIGLLIGTRFPGEDYIGRVEIFFHFDPLLALATFVASRAVFLSFSLAAVTIVATFILGRVACGWVCPLGSLHQFFSFVFKKSKLLKPKINKDRWTAWKYYILVFILLSALFTLDLVGLLDPLSLLYRSSVVSLLPVANIILSSFLKVLYQLNLTSLADSLFQVFENWAINSSFLQGLFLGIVFVGTVLLNLSRERFWCRYICPLGAFLALNARWNVIKLEISAAKCTECNLCTIHCPTQAHPFPNEDWKSSECVYCFTCGSICPTAAISFPVRRRPERIETVDITRRRLILTSVVGALAVPFFRISPAHKRASEKLIRPPGALPEEKFLQRCIKCGECLKVCPTNGLQPALTEAGPEGIWTPVLVPRIGYCDHYCSLCTQVCPTGAIKELSLEEKNKVKIGTAWVDRNRCLPWMAGIPCIVCEEHCPVSPKAIKFITVEVKLPDGTVKNPQAPVVEMKPCTGCGICETKCPVVDQPAIYITSVGESRSEKNQVLLEVISPE